MTELTRCELIDMICPTSATYDCCTDNDENCNCSDCCGLLNYLLDSYDIGVRARVIDEFVKAIEKHQTRQDNYLNPPYVEMGLDMTDVLKVAEQLKGSVK